MYDIQCSQLCTAFLDLYRDSPPKNNQFPDEFHDTITICLPTLKALRDIDDVHESWEHRATDERLSQIRAATNRLAATRLSHVALMWHLLLALVVALVAVVVYQICVLKA